MADSGRNVLIIDDDEDYTKLLAFVLRRDRNDTVRYSANGYTGLAMAEQEPPDLVILDIMLPGLDGYEVYRRLRSIPALQQTPILFSDDAGIKNIIQTVQQVGAAGFLPKPVKIEELLKARDAALRGETYYP